MTKAEAFTATKRGYLITDKYNPDYMQMCLEQKRVSIQLIGEDRLEIDYAPCRVPIAKDYLTELVMPSIRPYLSPDAVVTLGPKTITITGLLPGKAQECAEFAAIHQL